MTETVTQSPASAPPSNETGDIERWIGSTFATAIRRAQFAAPLLIQPVLVAASLVSGIAVPRPIVFLISGIVVIAGLAVLLLRAHPLLLLLSYYAALAFYYVVALSPNDSLIGVLIPLTSWTIVLPVMLRSGARSVISSVLLIAVFGTVITVAHPGWDRAVLGISVTTNLILVVAAVALMLRLRRIADSVDRRKKMAAQEELRAVRARTLREATAEYIRVLHDTIVNTFGALARDQSHGMSVEEAQDRCQRDLDRIRAYQRKDVGRAARFSLADLDSVGLPVRWSGISGDDLRRFQALLPVPVLQAVYGCAAEAVLNATKHSGADHVVCDVRYVERELRVEISDDGRGFDRDRVTERGIASSLFARAEANGIEAELNSVPGVGTTVRFTCPLGQSASTVRPASAVEAVKPIRDFELRAALAWTAAASIIGLVSESLVHQRGAFSAYVLLAMVVLLAGVVWVMCRHRRPAPGWVIALLLTAVPIANWCALAAVGYGQDAPYLFQAMPLTALPFLLHAVTPTRRPFAAAVVLHLLSTLLIAGIVAGLDPALWADMILLEGPALALLAGVFIFLHGFRSVGAELSAARRDTDRATREAVIHEAAAEVQMRWNASSLQTPFQLLQEIADGTISPADPETRRRCGVEEAYLRQVSAVAQDATSMSWWLALALAESRVRSVRLRLQAEHAQIDEPRDADALGRLMLDCITSSPENAALMISIVQHNGAPHMLIVGDDDSRLAERARTHASATLIVRCEELPGQTLVEATLARPRL